MHAFLVYLATLLWLLSPPAGAAPLSIVTHTSGTITFGSPALHLIDMMPDDDASSAPFSLHLETAFDPDSPDVVPDPFYGNPTDYSTEVYIRLSIGDRLLSYRGLAQASVKLDARGTYVHSVDLPYSWYDMTLSNYLHASPDVLGTDPFALRDLAGDVGLSGGFSITLWPENPDAPGPRGDSADGTMASLQVISAVPEPNGPILLVAGLFVLGMWRRRQRQCGRRRMAPPVSAGNT